MTCLTIMLATSCCSPSIKSKNLNLYSLSHCLGSIHLLHSKDLMATCSIYISESWSLLIIMLPPHLKGSLSISPRSVYSTLLQFQINLYMHHCLILLDQFPKSLKINLKTSWLKINLMKTTNSFCFSKLITSRVTILGSN